MPNNLTLILLQDNLGHDGYTGLGATPQTTHVDPSTRHPPCKLPAPLRGSDSLALSRALPRYYLRGRNGRLMQASNGITGDSGLRRI